MKRNFLLRCAIILFAFVLRVIALNTRPLWYDEAFAILYASRAFEEMVAGTVTQVAGVASDVHPLFYYFSIHLWMKVAGDSAFVARFWSVCFGVATIPLVMQSARLLFGRRVAMLAAFVVAFAPFHLAYSQEARMYAQLGFWCMLALWIFLRQQRAPTRWGWVWFTLAGTCALYSHNLAFLNFAALGLWVVFAAVHSRQICLLRATVLAGLGMLGLWLPWLMFVPGQFGKIAQAYWVPAPTFMTLIQTLMVFAFGFDNAVMPVSFAPLFLFGALLAPLLIAFEWLRARRQRMRVETSLAIVLATLPIVLLFAVSQWRPVYITRALLPAFFWYAILFAWTLHRAPKPIMWIVAGFFSITVIASLPAYFSYVRFPRAPFPQIASSLRAQIRVGDAIVHDNKLTFFPMRYYDRTLAQEFINDPTGAGSDTLALPTQQALQLFATTLGDATRHAPRIWFVIFQNAIDEAETEGRAPGNLAWLDQNFRRVSMESFQDVRVILYETR